MKKQHFKIVSIISLAIILAFTFTACGEDSDEVVGFVWIPAGTFTMGSPLGEPYREDTGDGAETQHSVTLTKGFYMSKYTITQGQYFAIMEYNPSDYKPSGDGKGRLPVEGISWYDAIEFCNKLSEKYGLTPAYTIDKVHKDLNNTNSDLDDTLKWTITVIPNANGYRLPTEAEWEYACRAGIKTAYNTETSIEPTQANFNNNIGHTIEVGSYAPNAWGLYDMHGNVWEWCWDWYGTYPGDVKDYIGPPTGSFRVHRGGSWLNYGQDLRSAYRDGSSPGSGGNNIGFRVVRP